MSQASRSPAAQQSGHNTHHVTLTRRAFLKGALAVAALPALAACQPGAAPIVPLAKSGPTGRVVVGLGADPASLNPLLQTGLVEASVYSNIFDGLLGLDDQGKLQPALAESYRSLDERTWEFKLRQGVTFHNGELFDSSSVRATVERMLDPASKSPVRAQLSAIQRVDTPDPRTALIVTKQPFAPLLAELTGLMMLPQQALAEIGFEDFGRKPIGTGPFRFLEWVKDDHIALEANATYWRGAPHFRRLEFRAMPDSSARTLALLAGQLDLVTNIPVQVLPSLQQPGLRIAQRPGIQALYVRLNAHKPPLDDVRVRRALALAVNADELITTVYGGWARRLNGPYPPEVFAYDASAQGVPYNPAQARTLLREAGVAGGVALTLQTPHGRYPGDEQVPQLLTAYFENVGVQVNIQTVEWSAYLAQLQAGQGEHLFLLAGTNRTFDPHFTIVRLYTSEGAFGLHYYGNSHIDALAGEAAATLDPGRRRTLYTQILTILREDVPAIWLAQLDDLYGLQNRLNWTPRADSLLSMYEARLA